MTGWKVPSMKHLRGYTQHDSHEYLQALLHAVEKDLRAAGSRNVVEQAFGGKIGSTLKCDVCGVTRDQDEPFVNVSVEVAGRDLNSCLSKFTEPEPLSTPLPCDRCGSAQIFSKQLRIKAFPPHLVLHLKRFDAVKKSKKVGREGAFLVDQRHFL